MPKRTDIKKILVIGSGPIVIGQAAEFDYAGTQACLALKEEGYEVVLCNSNPATIMTDTSIADKVYMEPLTLEYVAKILLASSTKAHFLLTRWMYFWVFSKLIELDDVLSVWLYPFGTNEL